MSKLSYIKADLFSAPDHTILVHACNTVGSWGGGIALAFREKYPAQYRMYNALCREYGDELIGTCFLIPGERHHIACLFTSRAYGRRKDKPAEILAATRLALQDLQRQNKDGRKLHAWYVWAWHFFLANFMDTNNHPQSLQFWKICGSLARY